MSAKRTVSRIRAVGVALVLASAALLLLGAVLALSALLPLVLASWLG